MEVEAAAQRKLLEEKHDTEDQNELVELSKLKYKRGQVDFQENPIARNKMKGFFQISKTETELYSYFCNLCGGLILVSNQNIIKLPQRRTDNAIVYDLTKYINKTYLVSKGQFYIEREEGVEHQYLVGCIQCQVPIGYLTFPYEHTTKLQNSQNEEDKKKICKELEIDMPYLYMFQDAIAQNTKFSKLLHKLKQAKIEGKV